MPYDPINLMHEKCGKYYSVVRNTYEASGDLISVSLLYYCKNCRTYLLKGQEFRSEKQLESFMKKNSIKNSLEEVLEMNTNERNFESLTA